MPTPRRPSAAALLVISLACGSAQAQEMTVETLKLWESSCPAAVTAAVDKILKWDYITIDRACREEQANASWIAAETERIAGEFEKMQVLRNKVEESEKERKAHMVVAEIRRTEQAKRPGARLGMTREQVLNKTNWGAPKDSNRAITRYGTHEQWIYGGHSYLYFTNGRLTTIQQ